MPTRSSARKKSGNTPVLDQGIAITGEVLVKLFGMKLLPVKVRLLISSKELAADLGLDWWNQEEERPTLRRRRGARRQSAKGTSPARSGSRNGARTHA